MSIEFRDVLTPDSPFWEKCARHQNLSTSRNIAPLFLCDECAIRLTNDCFNQRPPIYHGQGLVGYCGLCNEWREIALRQWFIDPICLNVVYGYPKSIAACKLIFEKWHEIVTPHFPNLELQEIDVVQIEPFIPGKRSALSKKAAIDFQVTDNSLEGKPVVFFIELKTGPSSLLDDQGMREFQLDVNDYVDIVNVMRAEEKPAYVFHAQVTEEYSLPTKRSIGKAVWWTDIFTLRANLKQVRHRRGEDKDAGYYDPKAFHLLDTFPRHLGAKGYLALAKRLSEEGIADLP